MEEQLDIYREIAKKAYDIPAQNFLTEIEGVRKRRVNNAKQMPQSDADRIAREQLRKAEERYREGLRNKKQLLETQLEMRGEPYQKHLAQLNGVEMQNYISKETARVKAATTQELIEGAHFAEGMPVDILGGVQPVSLDILAAELRLRDKGADADALRNYLKDHGVADGQNQAWKFTDEALEIKKKVANIEATEAGTVGFEGIANMKLHELAGDWASPDLDEMEQVRIKAIERAQERREIQRKIEKEVERKTKNEISRAVKRAEKQAKAEAAAEAVGE